MEENINKAETGNAETETISSEAVKTDDALSERLRILEENWKREQTVSNKKELRIKELETQLSNRESDRDLMKVLAASIAEQKGTTEEEFDENVKTRKPDLMAQFEELDKKRKAKMAEEAYNTRANALWEEVKGLPETDEARTYVYDMLIAGMPDKAEARIRKMKDTAGKSVEEPKKPSQEEIEEAARKLLEEKGQLSNDLPTPVGTGKVYTRADIDKIRREATTPQGLKKLMEIMPEIEKADREGRVKV